LERNYIPNIEEIGKMRKINLPGAIKGWEEDP